MENSLQPEIKAGTKQTPGFPTISDTAYIDPNSKSVQDSAKPITYLPNKKLTVSLLALFLLTALLGVFITQRNAQKYRESVKPKQLLLPAPIPRQ